MLTYQGPVQVVHRDDVGNDIKGVVLIGQLGVFVQIPDCVVCEDRVALQLWFTHSCACWYQDCSVSTAVDRLLLIA